MAEESTPKRFAAALQELESSGDTSPLRELFADGAELLRPEVAKDGSSSDDPEAYWDAYRKQFSEIRTEFTRTQESPKAAWLEWTSEGKLSTGRAIRYAGVSLLELDGDGRVSRFATYYDTAAFLEPAETEGLSS
jgi:hypothetical protein